MKDPRKTAKADLESKRTFFIEIGLVVTLGLVFLAFEWKQYERADSLFDTTVDYEIEEDIIVATEREEPPPPQEEQPESQTLEIVDDEVEVDTDFRIDAEVTSDTRIYDFDPVEIDDDAVQEAEIFRIVEDEPEFPGGDAARIQYLRDNIEYPTMARDAGIEGTVFVSFVVEPDGSITNVRVLRGIGGGCDEEALRVVRNMPNWHPGRQRGRAVRVRFTLPIRFTLG